MNKKQKAKFDRLRREFEESYPDSRFEWDDDNLGYRVVVGSTDVVQGVDNLTRDDLFDAWIRASFLIDGLR